MKIVLAAAFCLVLAACDDPFAPTRAPAPKVDYRPEDSKTIDHALCLLGFTAIPLTVTQRTGHHLVAAEINGKKGLFVLDTGANLSVIDAGHAGHFGLSGADGLRGTSIAREVAIDGVKVGGVPIRQRHMLLTDIGALGRTLTQLAGEDVHGLIGQDVLKEHRALIDVSRPALYLIAADRNPAPVPAEKCAGSAERGAKKTK